MNDFCIKKDKYISVTWTLTSLDAIAKILDEQFSERSSYDGYDKEKIDMYKFVDNLVHLLKTSKEIISVLSLERSTCENPFSNSKEDDERIEKLEKEISNCDKFVDKLNKRIIKKGNFDETEELELIEGYESLKNQIKDIIKDL